jgi:ribonuclease-3
VLNLCIAKVLWKSGVDNEKQYAMRFVPLTHKTALYAVGCKLKLDKYVLWKGEIAHKQTVIQDTCEAILGAMFLDAGFERTLLFVEELWKQVDFATLEDLDPKSSLHNWANKHQIVPKYEIVNQEGPQHKKKYVVKLIVNDTTTFGNGLSIKSAEQDAARRFLKERDAR